MTNKHDGGPDSDSKLMDFVLIDVNVPTRVKTHMRIRIILQYCQYHEQFLMEIAYKLKGHTSHEPQTTLSIHGMELILLGSR
jgi:hypothetical protein